MTTHPAGSYWGRPIGAVLAELGDEKKLALVITFDITQVANNGEWIDLPNPQQRDVKMFCTEAAWPYTEAKLKSFGFNGDFANPKFSDEFMQGTELVCTINGKYDNFDFPRGAGKQAEQAPDEALRRMNARWKNANQLASKPAGAPPAAPAPAPVRRTVHGTAPTAAPARPAAPPAAAADDDQPPF